MNITKPFKSRLLAVSSGAVVVALAAGGVAYASTPSSTTPSSSAISNSTKARTGAHHHPMLRREFRRLIRHTVHAQLIVKTPTGYKTFDIDRGSLTTFSSSSVSITRPDGPTVSATITSKTHFVGIPESKWATGDRVVLVQTGGDAVIVRTLHPKATSATG